MNVIREINSINEKELRLDLNEKASWHENYRNSAYVYAGGLDFELTEGDILAVFSQYGDIVDINLIRDKVTGKSKGYCFLCYEDQRSTNCAVDNFNGMKLCGRTIRVDHCSKYKPPKVEPKELEKMKKKMEKKEKKLEKQREKEERKAAKKEAKRLEKLKRKEERKKQKELERKEREEKERQEREKEEKEREREERHRDRRDREARRDDREDRDRRDSREEGNAFRRRDKEPTSEDGKLQKVEVTTGDDFKKYEFASKWNFKTKEKKLEEMTEREKYFMELEKSAPRAWNTPRERPAIGGHKDKPQLAPLPPSTSIPSPPDDVISNNNNEKKRPMEESMEQVSEEPPKKKTKKVVKIAGIKLGAVGAERTPKRFGPMAPPVGANDPKAADVDIQEMNKLRASMGLKPLKQ